MGRLDGKIALVTGAGSGMGRACVEIFAKEGATVVGAGRRLDPLIETRARVLARGGVAEVVQCDVSNEGDAVGLVDRCKDMFGRLDVLINNAAMGGTLYSSTHPDGCEEIFKTPTTSWHELFKNNADSVFYMCRAAIGVMRDQGGGSIVNVTSIATTKPFPTYHAYAATKAAVQNLSRSMAWRYGRENIRTNCICPGTTDTPMMEGSPSIANLAPGNPARFDFNPMGRAGTPEDMAYGCLYLASDEAAYVNGVVLAIDGGALSCPT